MRRIWIKNIDVTKAHAEATKLENKTGNMYIVGNAQPDDINSAVDLSVMGMAGIYMEYPSGVPDPNCPNCRGTGEIILFTSSSQCDCVGRIKDDEDDWNEEIGYWCGE